VAWESGDSEDRQLSGEQRRKRTLIALVVLAGVDPMLAVARLAILGEAPDRDAEFFADHLGDRAQRHASFSDAMQAGSGTGILERQPEEARRVQLVHRGSAIRAVRDKGGDVPASCEVDHRRNEAVVAGAMDEGRQPHDAGALAVAGSRQHRRVGRAAQVGRTLRPRRVLLRGDTAGAEQRGSERHDKGLARAFEYACQGLHCPPVRLGRGRKDAEVVDKGHMDHAVTGPGACRKAYLIRQLAPVSVGSQPRQGVGSGVAAGQSEHLLPHCQ